MYKQNTFYFESSKISNDYNKIPVVCLLGWAGSNPKNLKKYAQIYSDIGKFKLDDKI